MEDLYDQVKASSQYIINQLGGNIPKVAMVTGTGLGNIADMMTDKFEIAYRDIPYFPISTVQSHKGQLITGRLDGQDILVLAGRWHYYEGYSTSEITLPIRVLKDAGVDEIIFTNVSGAVNEAYEVGDLIIINDHINMLPDHPLRGYNDDRLGPRFPDMLHTYDKTMRDLLSEAGHKLSIGTKEGVYLALQGPSLETPAEYRMIHTVGADLVGMSTVPEVIVAKYCGMRVAAMSIVSNVCYPPERITETTVEAVIAVAEKASQKLIDIIRIYLKERI